LDSNLNHSQEQQAAQRFELGADSLLQSVSWIGFYNRGTLPVNETAVEFTVRLFADAGGMPSTSPFFERTFPATFVPYLTTSYAPIYRFTIQFGEPFPFAAGRRYWLSVLDSDVRTSEPFAWSDIFGFGASTASRASQNSEWFPAGGPFALL